jgi:SAM-dependent methyltransferase
MTAFSPFFEENRPIEPLYRIDGFSIVRCKDSGLVYLENPLTESELEKFYSLEYFEGEASRKGYSSYREDEAVLRANFRELLDRIVPQRGDLLDVGCAYGYFLDEARRRFSVKGVEISEEVARVGRDRFQLDIRSGPRALDDFAPNSFDVITLWDVIEHLGRPRSTLLQCARLLRPGGELYLTTGDIESPLARVLGRRWRLMNPPQHITYFSEETMRGFLSSCGLEMIAVERIGKRVSLALFLFILRYLSRERIDLSGVAARIAKRSVYLNLFDVMWVRAQRRSS